MRDGGGLLGKRCPILSCPDLLPSRGEIRRVARSFSIRLKGMSRPFLEVCVGSFERRRLGLSSVTELLPSPLIAVLFWGTALSQ